MTKFVGRTPFLGIIVKHSVRGLKKMFEEGFDAGDNQGGSDGEEGNAPEPIKIGENEYTPDQLTEALKNAEQYKNLLPDYTRKSQELADLKKGDNKQKEADDTPAFMKPDWKPNSYQDLAQAIKTAAEMGEKNALAKLEAQREAQEKAKGELDGFIGEIKKSDKEFSEDDFYKYAKKHNFPINNVSDLKSIYSSYKEVAAARLKGETDANKNKDKRFNTGTGAPKGGKSEGGLTYKQIQSSHGVLDAVSKYLGK